MYAGPSGAHVFCGTELRDGESAGDCDELSVLSRWVGRAGTRGEGTEENEATRQRATPRKHRSDGLLRRMVLQTRLLPSTRLQRLMRLRRATLLHQLLARREPLGRPRARVPRLARRVAVHHVDALEREVRGLVEEEVDDDRAREVAPGEDEAVAVVDRVGDEGREEGEEEVPEPVARGGECGLARARAGREGLADEDPDAPVGG